MINEVIMQQFLVSTELDNEETPNIQAFMNIARNYTKVSHADDYLRYDAGAGEEYTLSELVSRIRIKCKKIFSEPQRLNLVCTQLQKYATQIECDNISNWDSELGYLYLGKILTDFLDSDHAKIYSKAETYEKELDALTDTSPTIKNVFGRVIDVLQVSLMFV